MEEASIEERLIVAVDTSLDDLFAVAEFLKNRKVLLKIEGFARDPGYGLIEHLQRTFSLRVFADVKLFGTLQTLKSDGAHLRGVNPAVVTAACSAGPTALRALKRELPDTMVLGVTVLTSSSKEDVEDVYRDPFEEVVVRLAGVAKKAGLDGIIAPPRAVPLLRKSGFDFKICTPNIRSRWHHIESDDQNPEWSMTASEAIEVGADRVIVGRQIVQNNNRPGAIRAFLEDIAEGLQARSQKTAVP